MTTVSEFRALIDEYGPPAPSLLPWLARWAAPADLIVVTRAAAAQAALAPMLRWPVVADAVAEVLAQRAAAWPASVASPGSPASLASLAEVLPQIAGYLDAGQITALIATGPRADVLGYAALANSGTGLVDEAMRQLPDAQWQEILAATRTGAVPPLANLRLLALLAAGRPVTPGSLSGSELAYLLPHLSASVRDADLIDDVLREIEDYLVPETSWYAAALSARAVPYLDHEQRSRLADGTDAIPPPWAGTLCQLAENQREPWRSAALELDAAHPASSSLADVADRADEAELRAGCAWLVSEIVRGFGDPDLRRWEQGGFEPAAELGHAIVRPASRDEPGQVPLGVSDGVIDAPVVVRSLVGECPQVVPAGKPFSLRVWISLGAGGGVPLLPFDVPDGGRDVMLILRAPELRILSDPYQAVHVPRDGASDRAEFSLQADTPGRRSIAVAALLDGTHLGSLTIDTDVESAADVGPTRRMRGELSMETVAGAASLIVRYAPRTKTYRFQLFTDGYYSYEIEHLLDFDPEDRINELIRVLNDLAQERRHFDDADARYFLVNKGAELWQNLLPDRLRQQFWDHRPDITQLTILSDKDIVPWEVLYPKDTGRDYGFLLEQFPVTRGTFERNQVHRLRLQPARFVLPPRSPSRAADEIATLRKLLGETSDDVVITEYGRLMQLLRYEDFGVLHFACHNMFDPATGSAIKFDKTLFTPDTMTLIANEETLVDPAPLIFINACRAAGVALSYNKLEGWATKFMKAGAAAFIGSLWEVTDETSTQFAAEIYRHLGSGSSLGKAVMAARKSISQTSADPTWLAYTVYGDPRATVTGRKSDLP
jgi:hypothetical protein